MGYAQTSALNNYLPKSGGTVTGDFVVSGYSTFNKKVNFSQGASVQNWLRIGSKPYGSQTTTNAYGFINVEQIESAQISALYIGSCYGGSNPVDLGTNPPAEYSAGGTAQTAIGMYRGSVGIGGK